MASDLTRSVPFQLERATADNGDGLTLDGYAAVYDTPTRIDSWEGTFDEQIKRGAFRKTIQERTPVLQFDHGAHPLIGSIPIGKITDLREDPKGLKVSARLSDNWLIQPIRDAIASGAVDGMSFRFQVVREEWRDAKGNVITDPNELMSQLYDGSLTRTLIEVRMAELGPVVFPAYKETSVGVRARSMATQIQVSADKRREVLSGLVVDASAPVDGAPADLLGDVARALLFDAPLATEDAETPDAPVDENHPSERNDAPVNEGHPSSLKDKSDQSFSAARHSKLQEMRATLAKAESKKGI